MNMEPRSFSLPLPLSPDFLARKAAETARANGFQFDGDGRTGTFAGMGIEGIYETTVDRLVVTIHRKPAIAPWAMIESRLTDFFSPS